MLKVTSASMTPCTCTTWPWAPMGRSGAMARRFAPLAVVPELRAGELRWSALNCPVQDAGLLLARQGYRPQPLSDAAAPAPGQLWPWGGVHGGSLWCCRECLRRGHGAMRH